MVSGLLLGCVCFIGAYLAFKNGSASLSSLTSSTGQIIEKGIAPSETNVSGAGMLNRKVFFFKLEGIDQVFAFYRPDQAYDNFISLVNPGDTVTVYYKPSERPDKPNLETFQVEEGKRVIISKEGFQHRENLAGWLAIIGGLLLMVLTFYNDRKKRK